MARQKSKRYIGVYFQELQNGDKSYYITYKENNKDIWKKIGLHSEGIREAFCHQKRNEITSKIRLGEVLPHFALKKDFQTFLDIAKQFYDYKELHNKQNKKTRSRVEARIKAHYIGTKSLKTITKVDIENFQVEIQNGIEPATVNFIVQQVGGIFNWAIENELTEKNPCVGIKKLKVDNARTRYLEIDEIKKLIETIKNDKYVYYFVLVALATGGRLQTICNIKISDIKSNGTIKLFDFKNNSEYYGFLNDNLKELLEFFIKDENKKKDDFLFQNTPNSNYMEQYYQRKLKPIFDILFNPIGTKHLEKVTIHTLRHTFASQLAINETPILTIKKLMNHNDINATMRYAKLSKSSGEKHVDNLIKSFMIT
ncbi:tyrosine-type recombinase/integrase [Aliarcobacter butzleri]|uniref:tyrosine-type recombinase/integrase n=1 Tax=Aliarcobacter butzleri TaxID=28197 RepID=UPI0021B2C155|nr:site-specific integrase [Aliarcobacter butzleri]MCT7555780.1 site-specific integrase [Aliarcobacter butzleri]MCT7563119.1 site-specific integrase [Aliarcobacter butzleri]MCT7573163.1 site-specific integrase [Aliarcobacter butzleri]MCT7622035.1 site-specific integrase [Aliarcobacter butzleri]